MKFYDVLIIGGGPAGSTLAYSLKSSGLKIGILDKQSFPRQKESCTIKEEIPELFFMPDLMGYGWVFRKGDYLNIGLGREDKSKLSSHVKDFCEYLTAQGKIPVDVTAKYNGHAYLLYNHAVREMVADNVLLIGDSAGLAYPQGTVNLTFLGRSIPQSDLDH